MSYSNDNRDRSASPAARKRSYSRSRSPAQRNYSRSRSPARGRGGGGGGGRYSQQAETGCRLFVGELDSNATENDFRREFERYGNIVDLYVNGRKGIAFVTYDDARDAKDAVRGSDRRDVRGLSNQRGLAVQMSDRHARGGGGRGGGGGDECRDFQRGNCNRGDGCRFSHGSGGGGGGGGRGGDRYGGGGGRGRSRSPRRDKPQRCYNCNKDGHIAADCEQKRNTVRLYYCQQRVLYRSAAAAVVAAAAVTTAATATTAAITAAAAVIVADAAANVALMRLLLPLLLLLLLRLPVPLPMLPLRLLLLRLLLLLPLLLSLLLLRLPLPLLPMLLPPLRLLLLFSCLCLSEGASQACMSCPYVHLPALPTARLFCLVQPFGSSYLYSRLPLRQNET
jgi:hypothetical protein